MTDRLYASDEELASWFARPGWDRVKATLQLRGHFEAVEDIDRTVERTRRTVWKDFSDKK